MRTVDLILKKRSGGKLTGDEIQFLIDGTVKGTIPDYQISAFLMAVCFQGMDKQETVSLTRSMRDSGQIVKLEGIEGVKVDKHSTGGVGDKTTLVVGPLSASCGLKVAKMSGRGLGHTGGTLDKLEAVEGFRINLTQQEFVDCVNRHGIAVIGQTQDLVPADKKLYMMRDATGTVESIPLIASSIMSKKLSILNDVLVLDVKFGRGAFMQTLESARELARAMVDIGNGMGLKTAALLTDMDQPLGWAVGNSLEVLEAMDCLRGRGPADLEELALSIGAEHLTMGGVVADREAARAMLKDKLASGAAYRKFVEFIQAQGGSEEALERLPRAPHQEAYPAKDGGYVQKIDCLAIGHAAMLLGAGRETKESTIDLSVGLMMARHVGDAVQKGEPLLTLHYRERARLEAARLVLDRAFQIGPQRPPVGPVVHEVVR
ncbi:MAG: thymidine phosphorylase [Candidatus Riflebacteria bacterium]|nr:thymidine phosphorylase [Candidatus Riflebacteria bacterium]